MDEIEQLRQRVQELEAERLEARPIYVSDLEVMRIQMITPMRGFIRLLLDDEKEGWFTREDRQEYYNIIEENIDRLERALNDLIAVGRIRDSGPAALDMNWQEVDICPIVEEVIKTQQARTNKHSLVLDCEPEPIVIETDSEKFANILHNLLSNAIKYSPNGGEIRITARLEPPNAEYPNGALLVAVKDQGPGLSKQDLKKITRIGKPRPAPPGKMSGPGIGMYLVINLIKAHHGAFWVDSEGEGKGATFFFRIPVKQPKTERIEGTENSA